MTFTPDPDRGISQDIQAPTLTELLKAPRENGAVLLGARVRRARPPTKAPQEGSIESLSGAESWHVKDGQKVHVESWGAFVMWGPAGQVKRPGARHPRSECVALADLEVISLEA